MKKIYYGGNFITLEDKKAEAILISDGYIKKVGTKEEVLSLKDDETVLIDIKGTTMMPAFIDAHSHFFAVANNLLLVNLDQSDNFGEIADRLIQYKRDNKIMDGKWIIATGYDHNILKEKRHITRYELDEILPNNPVIIHHKSGHSGVLNSLALKKLNITPETEYGFGGRIEKVDGKLTGFLEEKAFLEYSKKVPMSSFSELIQACNKAMQKYASYGITTCQDGMLIKELAPIYQSLIENKNLKLDVVAYMDVNSEKELANTFSDCIRKYKNHFKIGGIKIFLDGSPQGRTAWMRTPYIDDENYFGYGTLKDKEVLKYVNFAIDNNYQILAHCNGDKAAQQYIDAVKNTGKSAENIRPVLIHGQLLGIDQLKFLKKYHIIPSFFIAHIHHWGDIHIKNFGLERAKYISPAGSAKKEGLMFTFHQDAPVIEPDMFETISCAINRTTKDGVLLGEHEKISVLDAIKAVTINAAYQYFEENEKGSIKEGKVADLIILDKNPLEVDKKEIKNIKVLETLKNGKAIYKAY